MNKQRTIEQLTTKIYRDMDKCQRATEAHYNRLRAQIKREYGENDLKVMESIALTLCKQDHDCELITFRLHYLRWIVSKLKKKSKKLNIHTLVNDNRPNCMIID